ncbi:hypothetical protein ACFVWG_14265 [Kribbella sp. NPDC058245]|uniref:hypothetical protein n=1 Tax=Kribbella sp. NPDC058245 TaxID=3346399 RepID=UPI0036EA6939
MNRAQLAMAYQACEVSDLARSAAELDDPEAALAQAELVLSAARELVNAATRLAYRASDVPTDPLQLFAYQHPDEAAGDVEDWLGQSSGR